MTQRPISYHSIHFIRLQEVSIAVDKIVYIIDKSTTKIARVTVGVQTSTGRIETGDYGYEGTFTGKEFDLSGQDAEAFLRWQGEMTTELTPYKKPEPVEYGDPFIPNFEDEPDPFTEN